MVRVTGFEPAASWSQTTRATSCATPGRRQKKPAPFRFPGLRKRRGVKSTAMEVCFKLSLSIIQHIDPGCKENLGVLRKQACPIQRVGECCTNHVGISYANSTENMKDFLTLAILISSSYNLHSQRFLSAVQRDRQDRHRVGLCAPSDCVLPETAGLFSWGLQDETEGPADGRGGAEPGADAHFP